MFSKGAKEKSESYKYVCVYALLSFLFSFGGFEKEMVK